MMRRRFPIRRFAFRRALRWCAAIFGVFVGIVVIIGSYFWLSTPLPTPQNLRANAAKGNTRIVDRQGRLLYAVPDPLSSTKRPVPLINIPLALQQATIAVEDRAFYSNHGIDPRGIARAAWTNLRSGGAVAGGSTLTQQLARSFLLAPEVAQQRTWSRKLREAVLALKLTTTYSKDEILALYLNQIYYGGLSYGVDAAAQRFFGKPARDLDLAECALLAGLPQAPSRYNPLDDPTAALRRQGEVLDAMVRVGTLTAEQAAAARSEPLQFRGDSDGMRAPHFVHYVLDQLTEQLGAETVTRGGLLITTTLDIDLQDAAQAILQRHLAEVSTPRAGQPDHRVRNGAVVVLDPHDGAILALVGSPDFDNAAIQGQVNAALAHRQPGSAIKPLTYAAALEHGWTPATTILDVPSSFPTTEGTPYTPHNYDRAFHGSLSLREALATSSNVAAVRTLRTIGIPALLDMAQRLGITTLDPRNHYGLSLTLGGGEVTPLELTAAFGALANGGQRVVPLAVVGIGGHAAGNVSALPSSVLSPQSSVLSPEIAYLITDILSDRYARMRAFGTTSALDIDRPAAAKTGTTSDWRDNWTVGYTPDRVVGVWVGNADGQAMEHISGITGAGPVWHDVMLAAHRGIAPHLFVKPDGIVERTICAEGGLLPTPACPATRGERFVAGTTPTQPDTTHVLFTVDASRGCRVSPSETNTRTIQKSFRIIPPEAEAWAIRKGIPRVPAWCSSPENQAAGSQAVGVAPLTPNPQPPNLIPALLAPAPGTVYALTTGVPRERQQIMLEAQAGGDVRSLTIVIDGKTTARFTGPPYRTLWQLTPGQHTALVEVTNAQGKLWRSNITEFEVQGE